MNLRIHEMIGLLYTVRFSYSNLVSDLRKFIHHFDFYVIQNLDANPEIPRNLKLFLQDHTGICYTDPNPNLLFEHAKDCDYVLHLKEGEIVQLPEQLTSLNGPGYRIKVKNDHAYALSPRLLKNTGEWKFVNNSLLLANFKYLDFPTLPDVLIIRYKNFIGIESYEAAISYLEVHPGHDSYSLYNYYCAVRKYQQALNLYPQLEITDPDLHRNALDSLAFIQKQIEMPIWIQSVLDANLHHPNYLETLDLLPEPLKSLVWPAKVEIPPFGKDWIHLNLYHNKDPITLYCSVITDFGVKFRLKSDVIDCIMWDPNLRYFLSRDTREEAMIYKILQPLNQTLHSWKDIYLSMEMGSLAAKSFRKAVEAL